MSSGHRGVSHARNVGLREAAGQIIAFLDSDNTWRPDYLELVRERLQGRINASCYAGLQLHILDEGGEEVEQKVLLNDFDPRVIVKRNQIDLNAFAHTADLYWKCGGFDENLTRLVDWDYLLRISAIAVPEKIEEVVGDYFHHRGADRISVREDYKLNRLKIALKHVLQHDAQIHFFGPEMSAAEQEDWGRRGLRFKWHPKEEALGAWNPSPDDLLIWEWTPWDEQGKNLALLGKKIDLDCGMSFYHVPRGAPADAIFAPGLYRKFHFVVLEDPKYKAAFEAALDERRTAKDINPIDTLLVRRRPRREDESYDHFLGLVLRASYPSGKPTVCIGIQALSTENLMEWGDYHYARSLAAALESKGCAVRISCRDRWLEEVGGHDIFLHLFGINHPKLPPKEGQLRAIWIISHPDRVSMEELADFDVVFVASRTFAAHIAKQCPGMRVVYLPQATDIDLFKPVPTRARWDLAFVGNSRGVERPAVDYAARSGKTLAVWGAGWDSTAAEKFVQPGFLNSAEVADVYRSARIVLNDHWADQRRWGFVNNRIFDVLACNRIPLSDRHEELGNLFPEVPTFTDRRDFDKTVKSLLGNRKKAEVDWPRRRILEAHSFHHRAHLLLQTWGRLLSVQHPDGVPVYRRPRILYVHGSPNANTTRKRCFEISRTLEGLFPVRRIPFREAEIRQMLGADVVVFQRWTHQHLDRLTHIFDCIASLRERGKAFIYEIDDFVFHFGEGLPKEFMKACDGVFVSTDHLKTLAGEFNPVVHVLPNAVDVESFRDAHPMYLPKSKKHVLVASTDAAGLERVEALAERLRHELANIQFHFVSSLDHPPRIPNVAFYPMLDYERLVSFYKACDLVLNLAGVSEHLAEKLEAERYELNLDDFIDAKSELKFQEAGLASKPLVSGTRPAVYRAILRHKGNAWIAETEGQQAEAIRHLLLNPGAAKAIGQRAREEVLAAHTPAARWPSYHRAFLSINDARLAKSGRWEYDPEHWLAGGEAADPAALPRLSDLQQIQALRRTLQGFKLRGRSRVVDGGSAARVMNSLRWRMSSEVVESIKSPKRALLFPLRVARLYREWSRKKKED